MLKDIPIFHKTYELMLWVYTVVNKFPKKQRFVLGQEIEKTAIKFLKLIIKANYSREKASLLSEASIEINLFLILIRFSKDLHFLSKRQYEFTASQINEISKMLGGWLKYEENKP